ncbi:hypothetical protein [Marinobacter sp. ELB17]|uniref:hypothetical protein n=1 Tax=Marinobacter sp. ELB17 TaxID=270374 RepID=UPI0000F3AB2C|nr:hypothetical protein [Marinobacter sp. ELB17]EAZ97044.1 hypothetical protein MELB17_03622 [Marinobacter sp. ELB17]
MAKHGRGAVQIGRREHKADSVGIQLIGQLVKGWVLYRLLEQAKLLSQLIISCRETAAGMSSSGLCDGA